MKRKLVLVALLGGFTAFAADDPLPKAETILDRFIEVTGGKAAYEKRKSEIETGTFDFAAQGLKGATLRYTAAPDKSYSSVEIDGVGKIETGSADGIAWERNPILGPRVKSGEEKAQALREGMFNAQLVWRKLFAKAETTGVETIDGEECYKVVLTPAEGKPETTYYQKKSGLAVKTSTIAVNQMGEIPVEVMFADYKNFDGVLMPTKNTQKAAGQEFMVTIQSVKVNEEIPADRFEPPAEIKTLLNKAAAPPVKK
jgi:zinc protease